MGLSLEELGAEKVLGWSSKNQSRHYFDLAYIGRDYVGAPDADNAANLIRRKFAHEAHGSGRYRHIRNLGEPAAPSRRRAA